MVHLSSRTSVRRLKISYLKLNKTIRLHHFSKFLLGPRNRMTALMKSIQSKIMTTKKTNKRSSSMSEEETVEDVEVTVVIEETEAEKEEAEVAGTSKKKVMIVLSTLKMVIKILEDNNLEESLKSRKKTATRSFPLEPEEKEEAEEVTAVTVEAIEEVAVAEAAIIKMMIRMILKEKIRILQLPIMMTILNLEEGVEVAEVEEMDKEEETEEEEVEEPMMEKLLKFKENFKINKEEVEVEVTEVEEEEEVMKESSIEKSQIMHNRSKSKSLMPTKAK